MPPVLEHGSVLTISGDNGDLNPGGDPNRGGDLNNGGDLWVGQFTCDPGYLLVGSPSLKCRAGTWSSQTPKCTGTLLYVGFTPKNTVCTVIERKVLQMSSLIEPTFAL